MTARSHIPAIALLGLQLTECTGGGETDPLVGEWQAVEIDGLKYPIVEDGLRYGAELHVEPDLSGEFSLYYVGEVYDDIGYRGEQISEMAIDADAPRYRLEFNFPGAVVVGGAEDSEPKEPGEPLAAGTRDTLGSAVHPLAAGPRDTLGSAVHPRAAGTRLRLACTLGAEFLECEQTDEPDQPGDWRFARKSEDI